MNQIPYDPMRYRPERGLRAKIKPIDDWEVPEELKEMINEIHLMEEILDCNTCKYPNECENCARAIEDR